MEHLDFIKVDIVEEGIAVVTLNRPPVNAFNLQMYRELHKAFQFTDDPANNVRCVVVCAEGKMFSPGNDVNDFADDSTYQVANYSDVVAEGLDSVMLSKVPVVVAVNGACAGAGFCIPAVADVVVATEKAKFGITELNVGIIGGAAEASYCLPPKVVSYMSLTGRMMSARDMEKYSFVHKIVPEEQLMDRGPWTLPAPSRPIRPSACATPRRSCSKFSSPMSWLKRWSLPPKKTAPTRKRPTLRRL